MESAEIQFEVRDSFVQALKEELPPGAIVGDKTPLTKAWSISVGFQDTEPETDTYRTRIKHRFPDARVKNGKHGGDEWTLPFAEGISSGQSPLVTFLLILLMFAVFSGLVFLTGTA